MRDTPFQRNAELEQSVQAVMAFAHSLKRGDVLLYTSIERLTGLTREDDQWTTLVCKLQSRFLSDRNIAIRAHINIGYCLLLAGQQVTDCPLERRRRAIRQLNRGLREAIAVPNCELTDHQVNVRSKVVDAMKRERCGILRGAREQDRLQRRPEGMPQRPRRVHVEIA